MQKFAFRLGPPFFCCGSGKSPSTSKLAGTRYQWPSFFCFGSAHRCHLKGFGAKDRSQHPLTQPARDGETTESLCPDRAGGAWLGRAWRCARLPESETLRISAWSQIVARIGDKTRNGRRRDPRRQSRWRARRIRAVPNRLRGHRCEAVRM